MPGCCDDPPREVDLRGLLCPIPVIRTAGHVAAGRPGECLELLCTDPGVREDLPIWARMHGHAIEAVEERDGVLRLRLRIGPSGR